METIECSKCGAIFEKTGAKDKLRRFKDKRFMTTFHCPNCDARVILKNGDEPISIYLKRLERLKEQARRLGDRQEVNELQDEIDQINREIKMNAGKTKDKKFSMKGNDAYDPTKPKNIAKAKALSVAQGKAASDAKVEVKQQSDVGSNQWGIYVDGKLVEGGFFSKSAAEEASVQYSKDEAYDPLDPENIAEEKELAKARGAAAADAKSAIITVGDNNWDIIIMDSTHIKMSLRYSDGKQNFGIPLHINQLSPDFINALKAKGLIKGNYFVEDSRAKDSLFKGQKVTAIKSEQGLREGETYTVLGEEAIIKQVVGEGNTIVYKLQDSSGNVIVIESPEGLFYEVKDSVPPGMLDNVINSSVGRSEGWGNNKKMVEKTLEVLMSQGSIGENSPVSAVINKVRRQMKDEEIGEKEWKNHSDDYLETMEEGNERNNESLKVKIGDIKKNMDAARKMGYDTEPYQKEIDKLEAKDSLSYVTTYKGYEIASSDKNIADKFLTTSKGIFLAANTLEELKKKIDKQGTKDDNSKNGYYAGMTGKARTDNPFTKGTPEYTKWDSDWKIGNEDFKYESNKELFKPKDSDNKELKEMLVNDAPDYYGAIVATARRGNNPQMGSKEVRKNLEPFMSAHGVQFNEEEFNKAYKEFSHAGVSKAAFMKGTDAKTKDALMECMECGHKFKKNLSPNTFEVKCPKCGGYDVDVISGDSSDFYTKDPLTKKGQKILAAMKKAYGEEKGEQIFYASKNKGTISGVDSGAGLQGACGGERKFDGKGPRFGQDKKTKDALQEGDRVKINYGIYKGKNGKIKELAPSGQFAWVTVSGTKQGENNPVSYDLSDLIKIGVKDQEIKIIIGDDPVNPSPAEQKVEGNDVIYKEYTLKQLPETGEFEIYAPGGSIVGHAKALELAKLFVDRIVASRVGDEWSEEARKKL